MFSFNGYYVSDSSKSKSCWADPNYYSNYSVDLLYANYLNPTSAVSIAEKLCVDPNKSVDYTEDINLAGYKKEDISIKSKAITREFSQVIITAQKGEEGSKKTKQHTIWVDTFKYDIRAVEAKYESGMLSIKIPLKVHKSTKIEVQ